MEIIEINGNNYCGYWDKARTACRGIIINKDEILISYETKTDQYMIPGGGLEEGEDEKTCCIREIAEETGIIAQPSECVLEIDEYYENFKWINKYFICKQKDTTEIHLTRNEMEVGMEPRWIKLTKMLEIFSKYNDFADTDVMRKGMYLREYTVLCEIIDKL